MGDLNSIYLVAGLLVAFSILASRISARVGMPLLLLFLFIGMMAGEDGLLGINFDDYSQAYVIGQLALAMILLDGGLQTRMSTFRVGLKPALSLATLGVFITSGLVGVAAVWLLDLSWIQGLLVGSIVGSTDAAAVFSMLKGQGVTLNERVGATLEIESGTNDPMAIFLTLAFSQTLTGQVSGVSDSLLLFVQQFGWGLVFGLGGGWCVGRLLKWLDLASGLYALLTLALALAIFAVTNLTDGSGFLAIYLAGLMIGNIKGRHIEHIVPFNDGLAWLSLIVLFLVLGLLVTPTQLMAYFWPSVAVSVLLIFGARPIAVILSLKPFFRFRWREVFFISWVGLRGAVPIVLAILPVISGVEDASLYFNVAFVVVLMSLVVQGMSIGPMAKWMRVIVPPKSAPSRRKALGVFPENDYEMLMYKIDNRGVEDVPLRYLKFPSGTSLAAVFRSNAMIHPKGSTRLEKNDLVCAIGRSEDVSSLNKMFDGEARLKLARDFYGAFIMEGDAPMKDIAGAYGLTLSLGEQESTLGAFIARRVGGYPVVGDDVDWHGIHWVVHEVDGNAVTKVGLRLQ
ncbi:potassium/proton antiporter [Larsenimonas salina]|uniref:potassium/proton antiporter n=1 Tax=Larsenimonas salina TaxID=1295565 RepID=UPI002072A8A0|nr:potassium/proton antiporter [Larsenimonas salina]MCM5703388.1 potassium/proton antiporter [Larsenimonas salina]